MICVNSCPEVLVEGLAVLLSGRWLSQSSLAPCLWPTVCPPILHYTSATSMPCKARQAHTGKCSIWQLCHPLHQHSGAAVKTHPCQILHSWEAPLKSASHICFDGAPLLCSVYSLWYSAADILITGFRRKTLSGTISCASNLLLGSQSPPWKDFRISSFPYAWKAITNCPTSWWFSYLYFLLLQP